MIKNAKPSPAYTSRIVIIMGLTCILVSGSPFAHGSYGALDDASQNGRRVAMTSGHVLWKEFSEGNTEVSDGRIMLAGSPATALQSAEDGLSSGKAIKISGITRFDALAEIEYREILRHFPNGKIVSQELLRLHGKVLDKFRIRLPSGQEKEMFFDISEYWAKKRK